ncbi:MAG: hypothetical protein U0793_27625 [Gemmataceae bacterium]
MKKRKRKLEPIAEPAPEVVEPRRRVRPFIIELTTTQGKVTERYSSYERARERILEFPTDSVIGVPCIFQELPDGSFRVVREDGKPLQWHRIEDDENVAEEPLPLTEEEPSGKPIRFREAAADEG